MVQTSDLYKNTGDNQSSPKKSKPWRQRLASFLPVGLLLAFTLLLILLFSSRFVPARKVEIVSVVTQRSQSDAASTITANLEDGDDVFEGRTLFQASGWLEAKPQLIRVSALEGGFVDEVYVLGGDSVVRDQLLVKLVDIDTRLDLESAEAMCNEQAAALAETQALVRSTQASIQRLRVEIETAKARLDELLNDEKRFNSLGPQALPEREIVQSRLRVLTQRSAICALESQYGELEAELEARRASSERASHALKLTQIDRARKQLALERMEIRSPIDGVVQQLDITPGMKLFAMMDNPESATVAKLFVPDSLQARIDVPLEEAAQLAIGQAVRLRCVFLPDRIFKGRVTHIMGQADLQRNTLQAKVELLDPVETLRPEMLCRAEFLASSKRGTPSSIKENSRVTVYLPAEALLNQDGDSYVWLQSTATNRATFQKVLIDPEEKDGFYRVIKGLKSGARLVINPPDDLEEGDRIAAKK